MQNEMKLSKIDQIHTPTQRSWSARGRLFGIVWGSGTDRRSSPESGSQKRVPLCLEGDAEPAVKGQHRHSAVSPGLRGPCRLAALRRAWGLARGGASASCHWNECSVLSEEPAAAGGRVRDSPLLTPESLCPPAP